jgi:predicted RNA-binding protein YlxR (DUF448 family)
VPERTCIGCGRKASRSDLVRLRATPGGPRLDPRRCGPGRGAWLCPTPQCFDAAVKRRRFAGALAPLREEFLDLIGVDLVGAQSRRDDD